jgi:hypothetical protein
MGSTQHVNVVSIIEVRHGRESKSKAATHQHVIRIIRNGPPVSKVDHTGFYLIYKFFTQTFVIGLGGVAFLNIAHVKPTRRAHVNPWLGPGSKI